MGAAFEEVRKVSTDDDESPRSPLVSSSPTGDLSDCELRSVCALWSEAFPTAPGRDRYAEALARLDGAAEAREQVHAVFEADGACVVSAGQTAFEPGWPAWDCCLRTGGAREHT